MDVPGDEGLLMWSLILWCDQFTSSSSDRVVFHDFVISPETNFSVFAALNGVKSPSCGSQERAGRSRAAGNSAVLCVSRTWDHPGVSSAITGVFTRRKKERPVPVCWAWNVPLLFPAPECPEATTRIDSAALCCSLLPLCGQQVSWLTWTLWFCQQGEKGFPGETGLPGNVGYPGKEGDQGKLGEKVTDISSFFFLLSYRVPAQSSLHLFLLYYILSQSFFLNGNPVIKHPSL